ncbi:MAG: ABC transporter permease subunit [Candidatus Omnitrophica bacterium]|nr:ABC transporter permease subunit [Candidatus Omnitrophota bacterium]
MPLLPVVGRKSTEQRCFIIVLYALLILGAATMIYPFLVMLGTSFTSNVDMPEFKAVPDFFFKDTVLFKKYMESKYNEDVSEYNKIFSSNMVDFKYLTPPDNINRQSVDDWEDFKNGMPEEFLSLCHTMSYSRITPEMLYRYRVFLKKRFGNINALNKAYREVNRFWIEVYIPIEKWTNRKYLRAGTPKYKEFLEFKKTLPRRYLNVTVAEGLYRDFIKLKYPDLAAGRAFLFGEVPSDPASAKIWEEFIRKDCPLQFILLKGEAAPLYRKFLQDKYTIQELNRLYSTSYQTFDEVPFLAKVPEEGLVSVDWIEFLENNAPPEYILLNTPDIMYREFLKEKYKDIEALNTAYGRHYPDFSKIEPPFLESDWQEFRENKGEIKKEFIVKNYREVIVYLSGHGRAIVNTIVLVVGLLAVTLIVNPLAAYALSRFELPATYKILLFLLATMAFPAEVSAIPNFLLLKKLKLLGTYWALILPAMANGYAIFLLKGFFDSLPKELYEMGEIEGAKERHLIWHVTLPLSTPVLAVIALGTFTAAYGSFMWAFLVCQDPDMWTIMVWLYQFQQWAPQFVIFAALVIAAIPTLLAFIFCQNIIMKGVILPVEK